VPAICPYPEPDNNNNNNNNNNITVGSRELPGRKGL
jgi:hypothetical protein